MPRPSSPEVSPSADDSPKAFGRSYHLLGANPKPAAGLLIPATDTICGQLLFALRARYLNGFRRSPQRTSCAMVPIQQQYRSQISPLSESSCGPCLTTSTPRAPKHRHDLQQSRPMRFRGARTDLVCATPRPQHKSVDPSHARAAETVLRQHPKTGPRSITSRTAHKYCCDTLVARYHRNPSQVVECRPLAQRELSGNDALGQPFAGQCLDRDADLLVNDHNVRLRSRIRGGRSHFPDPKTPKSAIALHRLPRLTLDRYQVREIGSRRGAKDKRSSTRLSTLLPRREGCSPRIRVPERRVTDATRVHKRSGTLRSGRTN